MGRPRRRGRSAFAGVIALVALVTIFSSPASAHASLVTSEPADGEVLAAAPRTLRLTFSEPVLLDLSHFELQRPDGSRLPLGRPYSGTGKPREVDVPVGILGRASYIVTWHAGTRDGHIAAGQILFSLGAPIGGLKSSGRGLDLRSLASGVARDAWYLAMSLTAGLLFALFWGRRNDDASWDDEHLTVEFRRLAERGLLLSGTALVAASLTRLSLVIVQTATNPGTTRSALSVLKSALTSYQGRMWIGIVVLAIAVGAEIRPLPRSGAKEWRDFLPVGVALLVMCGLDAATGHAGSRPAPLLASAVTGLHLGSAAVWIGTLAAFTAIVTRRSFRGHDVIGRRQIRDHFLSAFSPVATLSLGALIATGAWLGAVSLGPMAKLATTAYGRTALAKATVLVVAATIGLYHRLSFAGPSSSVLPGGRPRWGRPRIVGTRSSVTVPAEVAVLAVGLGLAAVLTGLQPAGQLIAYRNAQAKAQAVVANPADCEKTPAFVLGCWQRYFGATVRRKDASVALVDLKALSTTSPLAQGQCHQLAHGIGRTAAFRYPSLGAGLAAGQQLGTICNSGYFHGLLEAYTSAMSDNTLRAKLSTLCVVPGVRRHSFADYTCLHGLGHGLALRYANDVFKALPLCEVLNDLWDQESCYRGVFMQNVIADLEGSAVDIKLGDPIFPCNAVPERQKSSCYVIVTATILKQYNWDYRAAFLECDKVEKSYVDTCYGSMGRDISGAALLDPTKTLQLCSLGSNSAAVQDCIDSAAANAISEDHNGDKAGALCQAAAPQYRDGCYAARSRLLTTL